ncbi:DgyrCDS7921 [Dimorphilus gyrociliatus]|uniref:Armadillo repeat-containing protein 8 n=1 Tax=Dimorphilus gyrociliatus TaxID=2664684 RepID=A0A7I8VXH9_9ANNE|nr:DgyrCDS7921 [Dimorphilus gyrociliatus]
METEMEVEESLTVVIHPLDGIMSNDDSQWLGSLRRLRDDIIGNKRNKKNYLKTRLLFRLHEFLASSDTDEDIKIISAVIMTSLALGGQENAQILIENGSFEIVVKALSSDNVLLIENCLRCLKYLLKHPSCPKKCFLEEAFVQKLIDLLYNSNTIKECVTDIMSSCCSNEEYQDFLCKMGVVENVCPLITSPVRRVQLSSLKFLVSLVSNNERAAMKVNETMYGNESITSIIGRSMSRGEEVELQTVKAKFLTNMYRCKSLEANNPLIVKKALTTLVRMCQSDKTWEQRVEGAETLAHLIEVDTELQKTAAICENVLQSLSQYFKYPGSWIDKDLMPKEKDGIIVGNELRQAAFKAFASLGANDEEIRKKIIETETVMRHIVQGLSDPVAKVQLAAVRCMLSLSRSVQLQRTTFQDYSVCQPLMKLIKNASDELMTVASSTLCNLLLEFSPSKEPLINQGVVDVLVDLSKRDECSLRLNGVWGLMNIAFKAEQSTKKLIISTLGTEHLNKLLLDSSEVIMKTLGLIRNLLSNQPQHIDEIMHQHGKDISEAVLMIIKSDRGSEVKEQAVCILGNAADSETGKNFIMTNDDILNSLKTYMSNDIDINLQTATVICLGNLVQTDDGAKGRQEKLRNMGFEELLKKMLATDHQQLYEKVKSTLSQFQSL